MRNGRRFILKDKRRYKRFTLNIQEINGKMLFATQVKVIDISVGGISIKANRRLNIGSEYSLRLEGKKSISLRGSVVWSSLGEGMGKADGEVVPIYSAGLKFTNMSAEKIKELLGFIECYKKEEVHVIGGTRLNVRFRLNDPEKVILNFPSSYKVKKIGLGGMLIESVGDLEIESRIPMELSIDADSPVEFTGRVVSCQVVDRDDQKRYGIGIEFIDLTESDKAVLQSFIEKSVIIEADSPAETASYNPAGKNVSDISPEMIAKVDYLYEWHTTMGYYKVLDVKEYVTAQQIKRAFLAKTQEFHPDKFPRISEGLKNKLNVICAYLNAAYSTLMDPEKRKEYDRNPGTRSRP